MQCSTQQTRVLKPAAIVIGASTGGPQALSVVLKGLVPFLKNVPVFVVLHMPEEFSSVIPSHAEKLTGLPARLAHHDELVEAERIYFSPGNLHLCVERTEEGMRLRHSDAPPEHFLKPSVDILFNSAASAYEGRVLGIVLSGMGNDGLEGARAIVQAGGTIIVQDKATSVVWGMPGAIANAGLATAILPVDKIASAAGQLIWSAHEGAAA